ncbi:MAG: hypothetical protein V1833_02460 [Elusimicrobiota bacterium]
MGFIRILACFFAVISAILIGFSASVICFVAVGLIKPKLGYDDSLDAFGVHGISGILGTLATGLFASKLINPAGNNGLFFGNPKQLIMQLITVCVTVVYTFAMTFIIYKLVDLTIGVRVSEIDEIIGLDLTQHQEGAYTLIE